MEAEVAETWSTYTEQPARRSISANCRSPSVIALPFGLSISRERFVRAIATTVSALAAFLGVLIVSLTAVILGLT
jgi:hypothetical protein